VTEEVLLFRLRPSLLRLGPGEEKEEGEEQNEGAMERSHHPHSSQLRERSFLEILGYSPESALPTSGASC
jgi:hypothetical protein